MKITNKQLRYLIKEQLEDVLGPHGGGVEAFVADSPSGEGVNAVIADVSVEDDGDEEVGMAINQLQAIAATAIELSDLIRDMDYVPEWGDGKISVVLDKLNSIRAYMVGKQIGQ